MKKYYLKDSNEYPIFEVEIEKLDKYYCEVGKGILNKNEKNEDMYLLNIMNK